MFYEILQSLPRSEKISSNYFEVKIYGYYVLGDEIKTLKTRVVEFIYDYKKRAINTGVTKLFDVTILPKNILQKMFSLSKRRIRDMNTIKLWNVR